MSLLEQPTSIDGHDASEATTAPDPTPALPTPPARRRRPVVGWVLTAAALVGVGVLVLQVLDGDTGTSPAPLVISDPKDRPGYRSPTIDRPLTSGDAKDWPGYASATAPLVVMDPKDRPGYRSPTIDRPLTSGDPKDWSGYGPVLGTAPAP